MNKMPEERFHELAGRVLAGDATESERRQLQTLMQTNPSWQKEFDQARALAPAVGQLLPLLDSLSSSLPDTPPVPLARLHAGVQRALDEERGPPEEVESLLRRLEEWVRRSAEARRHQVQALLGDFRRELAVGLRESPATYAISCPAPEMPMIRECTTPPRSASRSVAEAARRLAEMASETVPIQRSPAPFPRAELATRLRDLRLRLEQCEAEVRSCRREIAELETLLHDLAR